jgi:hypothetical protein
MRHHWNIGDYQLLVWPRWKPFFFRRRPLLVYRWVVYLWPLELRRFTRIG